MISFYLNYLFTGVSPNLVMLRVRALTYGHDLVHKKRDMRESMNLTAFQQSNLVKSVKYVKYGLERKKWHG